MTLTDKERTLIEWIAYNEMTVVNGARPSNADETCCYFWADEIAEELSTSIQGARGVAGSLVSKGLIYVEDHGEGDYVTGLTEQGFAVFEEECK